MRGVAPEHDGLLVGAEVGLHADRAQRQDHAVQSGGPDDRVDRRLRSRGIVGCGRGAVGAQQAHAEPGPREGVTPEQGGVDAELLSELADLDLVQVVQRLDHLSRRDHLLDNRHAVVVGLDDVGASGPAGLDAIGVDGALAEQHVLQVEAARLLLEDAHEGFPDDPSLALGLDASRQRAQERVGSIDEVQVAAEADAFELCDDVAAFVLAHQAVVDVQQMELVGADGATDESGADGGVDAAGGEQEDAPVTRGLPDALELFGEVAVHGPRRRAAADAEDEVVEHRLAVLGVVDLGVELEPVAAQPLVGDRRVAVRSAVGIDGHADLLEPFGELGDGVAVAHPHDLLGGEPFEQGAVALHAQAREAVLALRVLDASPVVLGDLLVTEAQAEHRGLEVEEAGVEACVVAVGGEGGAAGDHDAFAGAVGGNGVFGLPDFGEHVHATDLVRDEVRVLAAKVDHGDSIVVHGSSGGASV